MNQADRSRSIHPAPQADLAVLLLDGDGRVLATSMAAARILGRASEQLRGWMLHEVFRDGSRAVAGWIASLAAAAEPPPPRVLDLELVRSDGMVIGLEGVLYAIAAGPRPAGECVAGLKLRASRGLVEKSAMLAAQREVFDQVAGGGGLRSTLASVAAFAERAMPGESFCLLTPIDASGVFEKGLCPTLPAEVAELQAGHRVGEAWSPATMASASGDRLIAQDVEHVEEWRAFSSRLQRHGLIASWVVPVRDGRSSGVRAVLEFLLPVRRPPSRAELALLDELAEMVRLALGVHDLARQLVERGEAQRSAEATARQRSDHLNALVDTALDAVISIDDEGKVLLWSRQAESLFGWRSDEVMGRSLSEAIVPPELRQAHLEGLRRAVATGSGALLGRRIEITAIDRVGRRFPIELAINRMPGGGFSAFARDISDRRRAEAAVKASEERLKLVIDASADGFWDLRFDGGGSMVSDRCSTMLGHAAGMAPVVAPPDNPWVHPDDRAQVARAWEDHMQDRAPRYESEHRRRAASGGWRWVLERGKVVARDEHGRVQRVVGVVTDQTERRNLEASLSSAERLESLGLLASGFARELDGLLSQIRAHASLARTDADLPRRVGENLEVIQVSVSKAKSMARSLIGLAPGHQEGESETISALQVLKDGVELLRPTLARTVTLSIEDRTGGRDLVRVDPARLQQALVNLALRACEEMGDSGSIVMRVVPSASAGMLAIQCVDAAPPMPPAAFARLGQASDTGGRPLTRFALGMVAVARFAASAGGRLWGTALDGGNMVVLEMPLLPGEVPAHRPAVVLCEDHPLLRPMLTEAITAAGHRVVAVDQAGDIVAAMKAEGAGGVAVMDEAAWDQLSAGWPGLVAELGWRPAAVLLVDGQPSDLPAGIIVLRKPFAMESLLAAIGGPQAGEPGRP